MALPAYNPCVPFTSHLPGGLHPGASIVIRGRMSHMSDRFTVDLQCGNRCGHDNIALHLSIRPSEFAIVRNHYSHHSWGSEERIGGCPIYRGNDYTIEIQADSGRYTIRVNGNHFCEFNYRMPLESVSFIHISGETSLQYVGKEHFQTGCIGPPPHHHGPPPHHHGPPHHRPSHHHHHGPPHHHHHGPPHHHC